MANLQRRNRMLAQGRPRFEAPCRPLGPLLRVRELLAGKRGARSFDEEQRIYGRLVELAVGGAGRWAVGVKIAL